MCISLQLLRCLLFICTIATELMMAEVNIQSSVFQHILQHAHALDLCKPEPANAIQTSPMDAGNHTDRVPVLQLRQLEHELMTLLAKVQGLSDKLCAAQLADETVLQQRTQAMTTATHVLQQMVNQSSTMALRLKDVNSQQTIPVEPQQQAQFLELLYAAAANASSLVKSQELLQWTNNYSEPPRAWEDHLAPVRTLASACHAVMQQLAALQAAFPTESS